MKCIQRALDREVFHYIPGVAEVDITGGTGAAEDEEDGRREGRSEGGGGENDSRPAALKPLWPLYP